MIFLIIVALITLPNVIYCIFLEVQNYRKHGAFKGLLKNQWIDLKLIGGIFINVFFRDIWNKLFVKPNGYWFGSRKDTFFYVLAINNRLKTLTPLALHVIKFFDFFNKGFLEKAIVNRNHVLNRDNPTRRISQPINEAAVDRK